MVTIETKKIIITSALLGVLLILALQSVFAVEYESVNELRSRNIIKDVTYAWGYTDGYDDYTRGRASTPNAIVNKYKRVSKSDPDYFGAELAYLYKGSYTSGYSKGYVDAKNGRDRAVSSNFLEEYDVIKEDAGETRSTTSVYNKWNLDEIDTTKGVENLAYKIGYEDASKGNSKTPLKIMYDLSKDQSRDVRDVYEWIRENRGTFSKKYKEGYEAYKTAASASEEKTAAKTTQRQSSSLASQQTLAEQKEAAYAVGYKFGYADAEAGKRSNPQTILSYDWILNARYTDTGEANDRNWYTLPEGVSQQDVEQAQADEKNYLKGYREGYTMALKEDETAAELTDEEYVYQIGFEVGTYDAEKGASSNPYTYTWKTHRYVTKPEEIYYTKLIRYNRDDYIKGYRDGYSSGQ
ncbi:hypothetical protein HZC31_08815 [Candidatus Woesearchaeota archaeon]|nr:hypothetical protein [Candidatus Woesearchaeota archaeon]